MQQREFPSLLFFPNGEREFPSPSVFSLSREGIPLLFLLMMTILFSSWEQWVVYFFFLCFPFPHKRVENSLFSLHFSLRGEEGFRHSLYQFSALIFQYRNYFYVGWGCFTFFLPLWVQHFILQKYETENHLKFGYWQLQSKYNCIHFGMAN